MNKLHLTIIACFVGAVTAISVFSGGMSASPMSSDPALAALNSCIRTPAASASTEEQILKQMNPAINEADKVSWCLFFYATAQPATPHGNDAYFETWASDTDTFVPNPHWPGTAAKILRPNILLQVQQSLAGPTVPPGKRPIGVLVMPLRRGDNAEETRRNDIAFNFIVSNGLFTVTGLQKAFVSARQKGQWISFPADAIEVKANWFPVEHIPGYAGPTADIAHFYHVNTASDGKQYALVSLHIISKIVPNWTWATFEHENNPGRCEYIGCHDAFGAGSPITAPQTAVPDPADPTYRNVMNNPQPYAACVKSEALSRMFTAAKMDPAFVHYCLKGSQVDFTDATGIPVRLGNSITEEGFDFQSSCMSCHSHAAFGENGAATTLAGFDNVTGAPLGPVHGEWFWTSTVGGPWPPAAAPISNAQQVIGAVSTDFVWSIAFCAIDDKDPDHVKASRCVGK